MNKPPRDIVPTGYRVGNPLHAMVLGVLMAAVIYGCIGLISLSGLTPDFAAQARRYFLGHPVSIAATVLFSFALTTLLVKRMAVMSEMHLIGQIRDDQIVPPLEGNGPADKWRNQNNVAHLADQWSDFLAELPSGVKKSRLVGRLGEVIDRQSRRGTTKQLADDLRELSGRDADSAHDSLGMVRIIVWAIPMLGFLGTVIGITQTLGGLDFTNGSAAVDSLKSGLYVAFDTTALGLVLSVVAIFLQFPVERSEQRMLAIVDSRVGMLATAHLPSDEADDNHHIALVEQLCQGVQAAVAESLSNQSKLWHQTIDEARHHWQSVHEHNNNQVAEAFRVSLVPALVQHSETLAKSQDQAAALLSIDESLQQTLDMLTRTTTAIDRSFDARQKRVSETDHSMADAVRTLARAVDILTAHMSQNAGGQTPAAASQRSQHQILGKAA